MRTADIEITNHCNALCNFCPRDRMPSLGGMTDATFERILERLAAHPQPVFVSFCGFGEPLLHRNLENFIRRTCASGLPAGITTNASLLSPERTRSLLDAGLSQIVFSISDLDEDYEEVYNLDYNRTATNIEHFLEENRSRGKPCETWVSIVEHDINRDKLQAYCRHWEEKGIDHFYIVPEVNRGGALDRGYLFQGSTERIDEARAILDDEPEPLLCMMPFHTISISWEGLYLLCCQDWEKRMPLGHIAQHSVAEIDAIKQEKLVAGNKVCRDCSLNPLNAIRERLLEVDAGLAQPEAVDHALADFRKQNWRIHDILFSPESPTVIHNTNTTSQSNGGQ